MFRVGHAVGYVVVSVVVIPVVVVGCDSVVVVGPVVVGSDVIVDVDSVLDDCVTVEVIIVTVVVTVGKGVVLESIQFTLTPPVSVPLQESGKVASQAI